MSRVKVMDQHGRVYEVPAEVLRHSRHSNPRAQEINIHIHVHVHTDGADASAPLGCAWTAPLGCAWTAPLGCAEMAPLGCATEARTKR
jgi:hypothetical protein